MRVMYFSAGRGEPQQFGGHSPHQQQVGRGGTVVQERSATAAGRRDHVGQPPETEKRPAPAPPHGQMIRRSTIDNR